MRPASPHVGKIWPLLAAEFRPVTNPGHCRKAPRRTGSGNRAPSGAPVKATLFSRPPPSPCCPPGKDGPFPAPSFFLTNGRLFPFFTNSRVNPPAASSESHVLLLRRKGKTCRFPCSAPLFPAGQAFGQGYVDLNAPGCENLKSSLPFLPFHTPPGMYHRVFPAKMPPHRPYAAVHKLPAPQSFLLSSSKIPGLQCFCVHSKNFFCRKNREKFHCKAFVPGNIRKSSLSARQCRRTSFSIQEFLHKGTAYSATIPSYLSHHTGSSILSSSSRP